MLGTSVFNHPRFGRDRHTLLLLMFQHVSFTKAPSCTIVNVQLYFFIYVLDNICGLCHGQRHLLSGKSIELTLRISAGNLALYLSLY